MEQKKIFVMQYQKHKLGKDLHRLKDQDGIRTKPSLLD